MTGQYAEIQNGRLYYEDSGQGNPLVLLHGVTLNTRMWDRNVAALSEVHRVIRYDIRGFGKSSGPDPAGWSDVDDLRDLLDRLAISKCTLVGQSMGGGIAVRFIAANPSYIDALVLVDSALPGGSGGEDVSIPFQEIKRAAAASGIEAARVLWLRHPFFAATNENLQVSAELERIVGDYSGWHWLEDNRLKSEPPGDGWLGEINVPTLVIVGERDVPTFRAFADKLATEIPDARLVVMKGVGHMANMEDPQTFNEAVLRFLKVANQE